MASLTLDQANIIISAAMAHGVELGLKPLSIAVLCPGGHLIAFQRSDGGSTLRPQIAVGKASGALALGINSRAIADMAAERPGFVASLGPVAPAGIIPAAGGVIIRDGSGAIAGAVGITGDTSDNDETCAIAGILAAGLVPQG
jgi:uncharacterized protein GlcG (DUF336 family)